MNYTRQTITAPGGTFTSLETMFGYQAFEMYTAGVVTLTGSISITTSGTRDFDTFNIRWNANVLLGGFTLTICGITILQDQINQTGSFTCVYDGLTWSVQYFSDGKDQPQIAQGVATTTVPTGGGTKTLTAGVNEAYQRLKGPVTLSSNYTVNANTAGIKAGSQFQVEVAGNITLNGNSMTVFGIGINESQAMNGQIIIIATYDALTNTWIAASTSKPITTADIDPVDPLSVMGNPTNVSASPADITFTSNYGVLQRNGTTLTTGLLTYNNFDPLSVVSNRVSVVNVTSAQILASNTTRILIVPASGLNTVNIISSITVTCTFVTTAYTGNTDVSVYSPSVTDKLFFGIDLWGFAASGISQLNNFNVAAQAFQYAANEDLFLETDTADPTGGNGTAKITVIYQTINV
jgi:hypothetical protein